MVLLWHWEEFWNLGDYDIVDQCEYDKSTMDTFHWNQYALPKNVDFMITWTYCKIRFLIPASFLDTAYVASLVYTEF